MTPQSTTRSVWQDTVVVAVPPLTHGSARFVAPGAPSTPAPQPSSEEEADRWVEQALFDCYND